MWFVRLFCGTVADSKHVRSEGKSERIGIQPMVIITKRKIKKKKVVKVYLAADEVDPAFHSRHCINREAFRATL